MVTLDFIATTKPVSSSTHTVWRLPMFVNTSTSQQLRLPRFERADDFVAQVILRELRLGVEFVRIFKQRLAQGQGIGRAFMGIKDAHLGLARRLGFFIEGQNAVAFRPGPSAALFIHQKGDFRTGSCFFQEAIHLELLDLDVGFLAGDLLQRAFVRSSIAEPSAKNTAQRESRQGRGVVMKETPCVGGFPRQRPEGGKNCGQDLSP